VRFDNRIAAGVGLLAGAVYLAASLLAGHSARAELPPDLSAKAGATLDAYQAAALLVEDERATIADARSAEDRARFALPRSTPADDASAIAARAAAGPVVVVATKDDDARRLAGEAAARTPGARIHPLAGGARAWYLAYELPVPLFAEAPPPFGWEEARAALRAYLAAPTAAARAGAVEGVRTLARQGYAPTLLQAKGQKPGGGARKKISGGCG
jgi:hypothetical protein